MSFEGQAILVTGGTGSFGRRFVELLLREHQPRRVVVLSRDEQKQHEMRVSGLEDPRLRYLIGDVRDAGRVRRAFQGIDVVVHAAALKQIPTCEYNPIEAVKTNIEGSVNVIEAALETGVRKVLALSTDKAVSPVNLYGATKLVAEKLFVQANTDSGTGPTRFCCVRYGNVAGSRGSVIPLFLEQRQSGRLTVTDARMTRFWITLDDAAHFIMRRIEDMQGGEVFVPRVPSMRIADLAEAVAPGCEIETIGARPGEKLHELLISEDEARHTLAAEEMFIIQPAQWWGSPARRDGSPVPDGFRYSSERSRELLSVERLRALVPTL